MAEFETAVTALSNLFWNWLLPILLPAVGLYLTLGLRLIPLRKIRFSVVEFIRGDGRGDGEIPAYQALLTALSATVGTGNIAGVATAIAFGGPGALFYMWLIALVGIATKYAEAVLAVRFREVDSGGHYVGGPMYYLKHGLADKHPLLAKLLPPAFAGAAAICALATGCTVQSNSVAAALNESFGLDRWIAGLVMAVAAGAVLIGGIKRIAHVAAALVPFMIVVYLGGGLIILGMNAAAIPEALGLVFAHAFTPIAAGGGFLGATVAAAIRFGVARGLFSNEAGQGSAPIAHAAARTNSPVRQGHIAALGTCIDTLIVCTITGLVILTTGVWRMEGVEASTLTTVAFAEMLPGGGAFVAVALSVFAFTTILGWSYYGERSVAFLFGAKSVPVYRLIYVVAIPLGALMNLGLAWAIGDLTNAFMALPNLIGMVILAPLVFGLTQQYWQHGRNPELATAPHPPPTEADHRL